MFKVSDNGKYLLVEMLGPSDFPRIKQAILETVMHPHYRDRNDIWLFGQETISLKFDELDRITKYILDVYPPNATRSKTALVADQGLTAAFIAVWAESASGLPYEVQTFSDLETAEEWILDLPVA